MNVRNLRSTRQYTGPLVIQRHEENSTVTWPARISFEARGGDSTPYNEAWLQRLIYAHPELLPVREIEPAFVPAVPVCIELPTPKGYIDNFFITPTGNLVFAECKLWRNPEARRQVVAQVMDYVEGLTSWGYADLQEAVGRAQFGGKDQPPTQLYDFVSADQELDEVDFIDAVSRNLRLGRGIFLIVGDGIREETESLAAHLQGHAGIHFALALVELALFELPSNGGVFVQPRVIARTVNIERGIVRFDDSRISVAPTPPHVPASGRTTLTEEQFYEQIAKDDPELRDRLRAFIDRLAPYGIVPELRKSLILRWRAPDGTSRNIGYIMLDGRIRTDAVNWGARELGILDLTQAYVGEIADAIGGEVTKISTNADISYVAVRGHPPPVAMLLEREDEWIRAIEHLGQKIIERFQSRA